MSQVLSTRWSDAEVFKAIAARKGKAYLERGVKGKLICDPMCLTSGKRMSNPQSIIISSARAHSLNITAGCPVKPNPFEDVADRDLFNMVLIAARDEDEAPAGYFSADYNNRR